jgi:hypothetical protein
MREANPMSNILMCAIMPEMPLDCTVYAIINGLNPFNFIALVNDANSL